MKPTQTQPQMPPSRRFIFDRGQNDIIALINGEYHQLYKRVEQIRKYDELVKANLAERKAEAEAKAGKDPEAAESPEPAESIGDRLEKLNDQFLAVAEIALMDRDGKYRFTREQIPDHLDMDQIQMLADVWVARKVFGGSNMAADPRLAPEPVGANK